MNKAYPMVAQRINESHNLLWDLELVGISFSIGADSNLQRERDVALEGRKEQLHNKNLTLLIFANFLR